jgi:hypothetical protein
MDLDGQIKLGHLLFADRVCRKCGVEKSLIEGFYKTKKGSTPSCYSYVCKECTIKRILDKRRKQTPFIDWSYPDW